MIQGNGRSWQLYLAVLLGASSLVACTLEAPKKAPLNATDDPGSVEEPTTNVDPIEPTQVDNSGAFGKPGSTNQHLTGNIVLCKTTLAAGDLAINEIMVSSKAGSGDSGEWVEILNTRDCGLNLKGVTVSSPRGAADSTVLDGYTFAEDYVLGPGETFVVADTDATTAIPGAVFSWGASDVLKNTGDTVRVKLDTLEIAAVTYGPLTTITAGSSIAFPSDCAPTSRADLTKWTPSENAVGTLRATPNAVNTDVHCK